jgi:peptidyl-prolyl cis-trans isomerase B (cyclophilin B)
LYPYRATPSDRAAATLTKRLLSVADMAATVNGYDILERVRKTVVAAAPLITMLITISGLAGCASSAAPIASQPAPVTSSAAPAGACGWTPQQSAVKNTGTPPASGFPTTGTRTMTIATNQGTVVVALDAAHAPCTVASFAFLAGQKYFDSTPCHRLTTTGIHVLQCGDPTGTGSGGPSYSFKDENLPADSSAYKRGVVAMANAGPNTNGSQFFIVYGDTPIPPAYTIFGTVTSGLNVVDKIAAGGVADGSVDGAPKLPVKIMTLTVS